MEVKSLKKVLDLAKPALSTIEVIPIFSHYCFDEKTITAYNDVIGIQVDFETGIVGAVHGPTFLGIINNASSKELEIVEVGDNLKLKIGRTRPTFPLIPKDDFVFSFPSTKKMNEIKATDELIKGLRLCLVSVGTDHTRPAMMGVTLKVSKNRGTLYSTTGSIIGKYQLGKKGFSGIDDCSIIIPNEFCINLLKVISSIKPSDSPTIKFNNKEIVAFVGESVRMFGKLINVKKPLDFDGVIESSLGSAKSKGHVAIPKGLKNALKRSLFILNNPDTGKIDTKIKDGKMVLESLNSDKELKDVIKVDDGHHDSHSAISPKDLLLVLDDVEEFMMADDFVSLRSGDRLSYLVANQ